MLTGIVIKLIVEMEDGKNYQWQLVYIQVAILYFGGYLWGSTGGPGANHATGPLAIGDYFEFTDFQVELGGNATDFDHRSYGEELNLCHRYFFKNINESGENGCNYGKAFNNNEMFASIRFPTPMRATPTITAYDNAGNAGQVHKLGNPNTAYTSIDRLDVYGGMRFNSSGAWGTADTDMYSFTFQADAEL